MRKCSFLMKWQVKIFFYKIYFTEIGGRNLCQVEEINSLCYDKPPSWLFIIRKIQLPNCRFELSGTIMDLALMLAFCRRKLDRS